MALCLSDHFRRKAQRCFCGAANCRGRIGEDSDNEKDEKSEENGSILDESEPEDENVIEQLPTKSSKKERAAKSARRKKQTAVQRHNKVPYTTLFTFQFNHFQFFIVEAKCLIVQSQNFVKND